MDKKTKKNKKKFLFDFIFQSVVEIWKKICNGIKEDRRQCMNINIINVSHHRFNTIETYCPLSFSLLPLTYAYLYSQPYISQRCLKGQEEEIMQLH